MAVNRVPVLKRCRSLGLDPIYLGGRYLERRHHYRTSRTGQTSRTFCLEHQAVILQWLRIRGAVWHS